MWRWSSGTARWRSSLTLCCPYPSLFFPPRRLAITSFPLPSLCKSCPSRPRRLTFPPCPTSISIPPSSGPGLPSLFSIPPSQPSGFNKGRGTHSVKRVHPCRSGAPARDATMRYTFYWPALHSPQANREQPHTPIPEVGSAFAKTPRTEPKAARQGGCAQKSKDSSPLLPMNLSQDFLPHKEALEVHQLPNANPNTYEQRNYAEGSNSRVGGLCIKDHRGGAG